MPHRLDPVHTAKLVNRYFTPFGVVVVLCGIWAIGWNSITRWAFVVETCAVLANFGLTAASTRHSSWVRPIRYTRLGMNYALNIVLAFILMPQWPFIWLLFLVTVLAAAAYEGRRAALASASMVTMILFCSYYMHGPLRPAAQATLLCQALTLFAVGLFVSELINTHP